MEKALKASKLHDGNLMQGGWEVFKSLLYLFRKAVEGSIMVLISACTKIFMCQLLFLSLCCFPLRTCKFCFLYLQRACARARYLKSAKREEVARSQFLSSYAPLPVIDRKKHRQLLNINKTSDDGANEENCIQRFLCIEFRLTGLNPFSFT